MIYRVIRRTTGSLQPSGTFWSNEVLYCGTDLTKARVAFLRSEATDKNRGYGNPASETYIEKFHDEPDEPDDTESEDISERF